MHSENTGNELMRSDFSALLFFSATLFILPILQQSLLLGGLADSISQLQNFAMSVSWSYSSSALLLQEI